MKSAEKLLGKMLESNGSNNWIYPKLNLFITYYQNHSKLIWRTIYQLHKL